MRSGTPVSKDRRGRALAQAVEDEVAADGAVVVHDGPSGTVLAYRRLVTHGFHAVLTVLTGGLWLVIWLLRVFGARDDRVPLEVDRWGHVWARPVASA